MGLAQDAGGDHLARPLKRDGWRGEAGPSMEPQPHQQEAGITFYLPLTHKDKQSKSASCSSGLGIPY